MGHKSTSNNTKTTRASEAASGSMYKNVPLSGRTSVQFDPAKKDASNFYVHKRGGAESHAGSRPKQNRTRSND